MTLDLRFPTHRRALAAILSQRAGCSTEKARRWVETGDLTAGGWIGSRLLAAGVAMGAWHREEGSGRMKRAESVEVDVDAGDAFKAACDRLIAAIPLAIDAINAASAGMLRSFQQWERRERQRARYDREIATARARGLPLTATRIEAERGEWVGGLVGDTGNNG